MQPSMPRPSTSTFMNFSASISSLSHSMTCRLSIAAGSTGTSSSSRSRVSTKPPGMLRKMARRADQLLGEFKRQPEPPVFEIEVEFLGFAFRRRPPCSSPRSVLPSAPVTSSGKPSALPTSRTAPRER